MGWAKWLIPVLLPGWLLVSGLQGCRHRPPVDFSREVKPILNKRCISCHGGVKKQGGFSLLFEEEAKAPLESGGFAIVPGDPRRSAMITRLHETDPELRMPYHEDPLPEAEIDLLTRWIEEGAQWGTHWAFEPIRQPVIPRQNSQLQPLDAFVEEKMSPLGLAFSPEATPAHLARRAALDLIGFPDASPTRAAFLASPGDATYAAFVDTLLDSRHFGEKWASMWLDLARYADTKGYERDQQRSIWRYRDWLIRALNRGMPYDSFLIAQLAGDLLPQPGTDDYLATAFHRNTMTNDEGGTDNEEFRVAAVLDRVNTTWEGLMSTTFACVQCHSHPYDPFRHEDYYSFAAFFNNTMDEDSYEDYPALRHFDSLQQKQVEQLGNWANSLLPAPEARELMQLVTTHAPARYSLTADNMVRADLNDTKWLFLRQGGSTRFDRVDLNGRQELLMRVVPMQPGTGLEFRLDSLEGELLGEYVVQANDLGKWYILKNLPLRPTEGIRDVYLRASSPLAKDPDAMLVQFDWLYFWRGLGGTSQPQAKEAEKALLQLMNAGVSSTPVMAENPPSLARPTRVFRRGNWLDPGEEVAPGVPPGLGTWPEGAPANRLGLAMWMTAPDHPLTARTIVNRIWEQLFGTGLVETLEDLGTQGAEPSHRELLDYLSWQLIYTYRWSLKDLIREIMLSRTYQQSSAVTAQHLATDPQNRFLSRMNRVRLSGEQLRDQALAVSGALNPEMFGPPVMPYQPEGIWSSPYDGKKWILSEGGQQYRRAIYTFWKRTSPYPSMITFDATGREVCTSRRIRTNTPLQALATLNDSAYLDLARQLALRVWKGPERAQESIREAYSLATGIAGSEAKLAAFDRLFGESLKQFTEKPEEAMLAGAGLQDEHPAAFAALCLVASAILNLDDVITKS